jgi:hypothetical protein
MPTYRKLGVTVAGSVLVVVVAVPGHAAGFLDRIKREVGGDAVQVIRTVVPAAATTSATDKLCGEAGEAWCRNLTQSVVGSFSAEFVERMTREDLQKVSEAREQSIRTGEPQVWENPDSGARGIAESFPVEPRPPATEPITVEERVDMTAPILDAVGEPYLVRVDSASIMSGPGSTYAAVVEIARGARVNAIARVQQTNWFLVGDGPIGRGYLDGDLIEPAPIVQAQPKSPPPQAKPAAARAAKSEPAAKTKQVDVTVAAECYTTTQSITLADGTNEQASVTSCRTPNGWVQV